MNKLKLFLCSIGLHKYKNFKEKTTIYRCKNCQKFKSGPAIDENGLEIFVFNDGSCIISFK